MFRTGIKVANPAFDSIIFDQVFHPYKLFALFTKRSATFLYYIECIIFRIVTLKVTSRVRRVGNSLSIVIPAKEAKAQKISEGDVVEVEIQRKVNIKDLFGSVKFSKSAQEMKDEDRKAWGD